jgi:hypothetical protein
MICRLGASLRSLAATRSRRYLPRSPYGTTLLAPAPFQGLHLRWTVDLRADQSASGAVA